MHVGALLGWLNTNKGPGVVARNARGGFAFKYVWCMHASLVDTAAAVGLLRVGCLREAHATRAFAGLLASRWGQRLPSGSEARRHGRLSAPWRRWMTTLVDMSTPPPAAAVCMAAPALGLGLATA